MLDIKIIQKLLPHRYPMLLVDRVLEYSAQDYAIGIKNVSMNEWFFAGHFPHEPVMPGVLIIEALAQLSGIVMLSKVLDEKMAELGIEDPSKVANLAAPGAMYFVKIEEAVFKEKVVPGDVLELFAKKIRGKMGMFIFETVAKVGQKEVATAKIVATVG